MFDANEDIAPETLRSPPSSVPVRDVEVSVEIEDTEPPPPASLPASSAPDSLLSALLASYDEEIGEPPTCRYARVA